jgi:hypothetical protein
MRVTANRNLNCPKYGRRSPQMARALARGEGPSTVWRVLGLNQRRLSRRLYSEPGSLPEIPVFTGLQAPDQADSRLPSRAYPAPWRHIPAVPAPGGAQRHPSIVLNGSLCAGEVWWSCKKFGGHAVAPAGNSPPRPTGRRTWRQGHDRYFARAARPRRQERVMPLRGYLRMFNLLPPRWHVVESTGGRLLSDPDSQPATGPSLPANFGSRVRWPRRPQHRQVEQHGGTQPRRNLAESPCRRAPRLRSTGRDQVVVEAWALPAP